MSRRNTYTNQHKTQLAKGEIGRVCDEDSYRFFSLCYELHNL